MYAIHFDLLGERRLRPARCGGERRGYRPRRRRRSRGNVNVDFTRFPPCRRFRFNGTFDWRGCGGGTLGTQCSSAFLFGLRPYARLRIAFIASVERRVCVPLDGVRTPVSVPIFTFYIRISKTDCSRAEDTKSAYHMVHTVIYHPMVLSYGQLQHFPEHHNWNSARHRRSYSHADPLHILSPSPLAPTP